MIPITQMSSDLDRDDSSNHHRKKHHRKHHHKRHHKKHHHRKHLKQKKDCSGDEVVIDDQTLQQALNSIDNDILNLSGVSDKEEINCDVSDAESKDESTGQRHSSSKKIKGYDDQNITVRPKPSTRDLSVLDDHMVHKDTKKERRKRSKKRSRHSSRSRSPRKRDSSRHHRTRHSRHHSRHRSRRHRSRSLYYHRRPQRRYSSSADSRRRKSSTSSDCSVSPVPEKCAVPVTASQSQIKIAQFTEFCRHLSELEKLEDESQVKESTDSNQTVQHPFLLNSELIYQNEAWKTAEQINAEQNTLMDLRPVEEKFPVSSGIKHKNEVIDSTAAVSAVEEPVSDLVVQRATLQKQLVTDGNNPQTLLMLNAIEKKLNDWSQGLLKPGVFTGGKEISPLPKWEHDRGIQAWAKKNMFKDLAPVMSGFGMKMLVKMGWEFGKPLGVRGEGHTEPIPLDVKLDRQGLSTGDDKGLVVAPPTTDIPVVSGKSSLAGKHPVSALQELCAKKGWGSPDYDLISETGPSHMKSFMYRVKIEGVGTFQPACSSNTKKLAKVQTAIACLKSLGFMEDSIS